MAFRESAGGCQWKWYRDYLEGRRSKFYGIHMDFGTAMHAAIELTKTRKDPKPIVDALIHFEKTFKDLYEKHKGKYEKEKERTADPQFFLDAGKRILERFHECKELAEAEVVYNEFKLFEEIARTDDVQMKFKGYIDMVIKTKDGRGNTILYVCDFKTCSWGWDRDKRQDRELQFQIILYKHFLCKKFGLDPKNVRVAFVLLKKRPRKEDSPVEFFPISAGPVSVQRALDEMNADISEMAVREKDTSFKKNRKACINDFGDRCPYMGTPDCLEDRHGSVQ